MSRSIRSFLGLAAVLVALMPLVAGAQPAPQIQTVDQVRAKFTDAGYQVDQPTTWWTNGSTTFLVHDPAGVTSTDSRVLMVVVYPDLATAQADRDRAMSADVEQGMPLDREEPHLVPGFGPSKWQGNVALVEATWSDLNQQYQREIETDLGTAIAVGQPQQDPSQVVAAVQVDSDFITALQQGEPTVTL